MGLAGESPPRMQRRSLKNCAVFIFMERVHVLWSGSQGGSPLAWRRVARQPRERATAGWRVKHRPNRDDLGVPAFTPQGPQRQNSKVGHRDEDLSAVQAVVMRTETVLGFAMSQVCC